MCWLFVYFQWAAEMVVYAGFYFQWAAETVLYAGFYFQWAAETVPVPAVPVQGSGFGATTDEWSADPGDWGSSTQMVQQPAAPAQPAPAKTTNDWGSAPQENWS